MLETLRFETNSPEIDASKFERLQQDLSAAGDVKSLVSILGTCDKAAQEMIKLSERKCFEELMTLSSSSSLHYGVESVWGSHQVCDE